MKIYKSEFDILSGFVQQAKERDDIELELVFQNVNINSYQRMKTYLNQDSFELLGTEKMLRIFPTSSKNVRITVEGEEAIQYYCSKNKLARDTFLIETKTRLGKHDFTDLHTRVNMKREIQTDYAISKLAKEGKYYRLIERMSYQSADGLFRFDISCIRTNIGRKPATSFLRSNILSSPKLYEIEVEMMSNEASSKELITKMMKYISHYNFVISEFRHVLREKEEQVVMEKYLSLIGTTNPRFFWIGPKPVSLEHQHIQKETQPNLLQGYCATEKADGLRCLIYVDDVGSCYAITMNGKVYSLKYSTEDTKFRNSILDAEYVFQDKEGNRLEYFGIFDIYYKNGENIMSLPFVSREKETRSRIKEFSSFRFRSKQIQVNPKTFLVPPKNDDIWKVSNELIRRMDNGTFPYYTDGLIYQPMDLVVGGTFESNEVPANTGKTWSSVFKWKPPEDNSIDFLVKLDKRKYSKNVDPSSGDIRHIATCGLFVSGFKENICELMYKEQITSNMGEIPFQPPNPPLKDSAIMKLFVEHPTSYPKTLEGDSIENNTVVECRYDITKPVGFRWIPMRIRYDKTAAYKSSHKDRKTLSMNFTDTANSIWELTHNPITKDMITSGIFHISDDELLNSNVQAGNYYNREGSRQESRMITLQRFHNDVIKRDMMIQKYVQKGNSLLDLACGKGGDLYKWIHSGVDWVLGVDINHDNIHNGKDGICSRYINIRNKRRGNIPNMAFVVCDSAKPIKELRSYENEFDRTIINTVFHGENSRYSLLQKMKNKGEEGFDVIEMMFAIHYLMKDKQTLDSFMDNVVENIRPGGIFMFNSLNGKRVHEFMKSREFYRARLESDPVSKPSLWEIRKQYTVENPKNTLPDDETCLGKKISVYVESINNVFEEYLVNYEYLETYLREKGFEKVEQRDFEDIHVADYLQKYPMTRFEREYSYLHSFAVYRKVN